MVSYSLASEIEPLKEYTKYQQGDHEFGGAARRLSSDYAGTGKMHPKNMIRKLKSGEYRLYSRKKDAKSGKRRNLGTFTSLEKAKKHEQEVQYFKRH